jgi:hypothetical protein
MVAAPERSDVQLAERLWIQDAQQSIREQIKPGTMKRLGAMDKDGLIAVGSRLESWRNHTYNNKPPVLLSSKCRLAQLYAQHEHDRCHLAVSAVDAKIQTKFWIVGLRNLLRSIRFKCVRCKKLDQDLQQQMMGRIPRERLNPAPAWSYTSLDLFGPYQSEERQTRDQEAVVMESFSTVY